CSCSGGALPPLISNAGHLPALRVLAVSTNGTIAFTASYNVGGGRGVFAYDGQTLTTIADTRTSPFFAFGPPRVNNDGTAVFVATQNLAGSQRGPYTGNGNDPSLAAAATARPDNRVFHPEM